jgi:hypothetical protein
MFSTKSIYSIFLFSIIALNACKKFVEVPSPSTSVNGQNVFNEDVSANSVILGIYTNIVKDAVFDPTARLTNIFFITGLMSDELELYDKTNSYYGQFYTNTISPKINTWSKIYNMIFVANQAIEGLGTSSNLNPQVKLHLLGESRFIRALSYFYLVNMYGAIPLATTTDYKVNQLLSRSDTDVVYKQIIEDLKIAKNLLPQDYVGKDGITKSNERVRPNKWTASALLARVYLYYHLYQDAMSEATSVIEQNDLFKLVELDQAFLKNNQEAIWQLQPIGINENGNTKDGKLLKLFPDIGPNPENPVYLTTNFVQSFEPNDLRKSHWLNYVEISGEKFYFSYKYKIGNESATTQEYSTVFRLSEQYLIRAEAKIRIGSIDNGIGDINVIRLRATNTAMLPQDRLSTVPLGLNENEALSAVENERRHELFTEWGHRWFDLKRTNRSNMVLSSLKGSNWQPTDILFPLPESELLSNPNLIGKQNPGY